MVINSRFYKCKVFFIVVFILCVLGKGWAAEVIYLEGKVEVKRKDKKEWEKAVVGMELEAGDMVWTRGIDSRIDIDLNVEEKGTNVLKLGENTQIVLRAYRDASKIDNVDLDYGDIFSKIEKIEGGSTFEVYTLTAVAGVRGTNWSVSTQKDEAEISCYKGKIYVKAFDEQGNLLKEMDVAAGYKTHVKENQPPIEVEQVSGKEQNEWKKWDKEVDSYIEEKKKEEEQKKEKEESFTDVEKQVKALYEEFKQAYSRGDINGVVKCISQDWESSTGQGFYDLDSRLNRIFSTFDRLTVDLSGFSVSPSDDPDYAARVSYHIKIEGSLLSNPRIKHHDEGDVIDYIKKEKDSYVIGKTVGKGAF